MSLLYLDLTIIARRIWRSNMVFLHITTGMNVGRMAGIIPIHIKQYGTNVIFMGCFWFDYSTNLATVLIFGNSGEMAKPHKWRTWAHPWDTLHIQHKNANCGPTGLLENFEIWSTCIELRNAKTSKNLYNAYSLFLIMMPNYPIHGNVNNGIRLPAVVSAW